MPIGQAMSVSVSAPFPEWAWPRVWEWIGPFRDRVSDDFSPATQHEFVAAHLQLARNASTWGVYRDGELGGLIWIEARNPVLAQSHVIFKRSFWGRSTTEASMREVFGLVFSGGVEKIASYVFARNHAIISLARALGAKQEGLLRNQTMQHGTPVDMVALGLLKEDFYAAGSNHGRIGGRQHRGRGSRQQVEDHHQHDNPELHPGTGDDAESARRDSELRHQRPGEGDGTAEDTGSQRS